MPERLNIRAPFPHELPLCRRLLPRAAAEGQHRRFLVAADSGGSLLGAASWRAYPDRTGDLQLRVLRTHRRQGVGRQLVNTALQEEISRGSRRIEAWIDDTTHPEGAPFYHALGFATEDRLTTVEGDLDPMLVAMAPLVNRLRAGGRFPTGARVCRLAEALPEPVADLYGDFLNRNPGFRTQLFAARLVPEHYPLSTVVLVEEALAGFLLVNVEDELACVPARVVAPGFRGSWVNPLMLLSSLELGRDAGVRRVRFDYWSDNHDTRRLAHRLQAGLLRTQSLLTRSLAAEP